MLGSCITAYTFYYSLCSSQDIECLICNLPLEVTEVIFATPSSGRACSIFDFTCVVENRNGQASSPSLWNRAVFVTHELEHLYICVPTTHTHTHTHDTTAQNNNHNDDMYIFILLISQTRAYTSIPSTATTLCAVCAVYCILSR